MQGGLWPQAAYERVRENSRICQLEIKETKRFPNHALKNNLKNVTHNLSTKIKERRSSIRIGFYIVSNKTKFDPVSFIL